MRAIRGVDWRFCCGTEQPGAMPQSSVDDLVTTFDDTTRAVGAGLERLPAPTSSITLRNSSVAAATMPARALPTAARAGARGVAKAPRRGELQPECLRPARSERQRLGVGGKLRACRRRRGARGRKLLGNAPAGRCIRQRRCAVFPAGAARRLVGKCRRLRSLGPAQQRQPRRQGQQRRLSGSPERMVGTSPGLALCRPQRQSPSALPAVPVETLHRRRPRNHLSKHGAVQLN